MKAEQHHKEYTKLSREARPLPWKVKRVFATTQYWTERLLNPSTSFLDKEDALTHIGRISNPRAIELVLWSMDTSNLREISSSSLKQMLSNRKRVEESMGRNYTDEIYNALDKGNRASSNMDMVYFYLNDIVRAERSKRPDQVEYIPEKSHYMTIKIYSGMGDEHYAEDPQTIPPEAFDIREQIDYVYNGQPWTSLSYQTPNVFTEVKEETIKIIDNIEST